MERDGERGSSILMVGLSFPGAVLTDSRGNGPVRVQGNYTG